MCFCLKIVVCNALEVSLLSVVLVFFFFKQKTAYGMRISDWSSDVCSSDLGRHGGGLAAGPLELVGAGDRLDRVGRGLRGPGHAGGAAAPAFGWQRGPAVAFRGPVLAGTRRLDGGLSTGRLVGRGGRVRNGIDRALRIGGARARGGLARVARRGSHDPGASP